MSRSSTKLEMMMTSAVETVQVDYVTLVSVELNQIFVIYTTSAPQTVIGVSLVVAALPGMRVATMLTPLTLKNTMVAIR